MCVSWRYVRSASINCWCSNRYASMRQLTHYTLLDSHNTLLSKIEAAEIRLPIDCSRLEAICLLLHLFEGKAQSLLSFQHAYLRLCAPLNPQPSFVAKSSSSEKQHGTLGFKAVLVS